ncbi:MAG: hypothetical protein AAFO82_01385, partial [Bacteroidota bacterium]
MINLIYPVLLLLSTFLEVPKEQYTIQIISSQEEESTYMNPRIFGEKLLLSATINKFSNLYRIYSAPIIDDALIGNIQFMKNQCADDLFVHNNSMSNQLGVAQEKMFFNRNMTSEEGLMKIGIFSAYYEEGEIYACTKLNFCYERYNYLHPTLSRDGLTMIFSSDEQGTYQLYITYRDDLDSEWRAPMSFESVNQHFEEGYIVFPTLVNDNLLIFSVRSPEGSSDLDIYKTEKKDGVWGTPKNWEALNSQYDDFGVEMINETSGYFTSNRDFEKDKIYYFKIEE